MKVKRNPREGGNRAYFRPVQVKENTKREREREREREEEEGERKRERTGNHSNSHDPCKTDPRHMNTRQYTKSLSGQLTNPPACKRKNTAASPVKHRAAKEGTKQQKETERERESTGVKFYLLTVVVFAFSQERMLQV